MEFAEVEYTFCLNALNNVLSIYVGVRVFERALMYLCVVACILYRRISRNMMMTSNADSSFNPGLVRVSL